MFLGLMACKEKSVDTPEEKPPFELLTGEGAKNWHLTKAVGYGGGGAEVDLIQNQPCLKDNLLILKADGTYTLVDTGEICKEVTTVNDKWTFSENPMQLRLASISLMGRDFVNPTLNLTTVKANYFEGEITDIPANAFDLKKVIMRFEAEK